MGWRLEAIAPDVAERLAREPDERLREVAQRLVKAVLAEVRIDDKRLHRALDALNARQYGESTVRAELKALVDELDREAWDIQDRVSEGGATDLEYIDAFGRARAPMALWFALDPDPLLAAMEATYEVEAATDEDFVRQELLQGLTPSRSYKNPQP